MTFTTTPELTKKMIDYGTSLIRDPDHFQSYLTGMIEQFYPAAYNHIIERMCEWALYPNLRIIELSDLKEIEIDVRTRKARISLMCGVDSQTIIDDNTKVMSIISNSTHFGTASLSFDQSNNWINFMKIVELNGGFGPRAKQYALSENILSHSIFTNIVHAIWTGGIVGCYKREEYLYENFLDLNSQVLSLTDELNNIKVEKNEQVKRLEDTIERLTSQASCTFDELRDHINKLSRSTHAYVKRVETIPVYDYELIKARRRIMHQEYKTAFKFFQRLIQLRYETPMAVLVPKQ